MDRGWTFITNHGLVLLCVSADPDVRLADVATKVGITERAVQAIVADLVDAGYLVRERRGRRNHYEIRIERPLRHHETQHREIGELLELLGPAR
jgi:predicted transcriptional regulator